MVRILTAVVILLVMAPAMAQEADRPDTEGGRYILRRVDDGLMRVDRDTGVTSFCRKRGGAWVCETVADDREAFEDEIARLAQDNAELAREVGRLKARIARLEGGPDALAEGDDETGKPRSKTDDPSEDEIDKAMRTVESMMRRFMDMAQELREDYGKPDDRF